MKKYDFIFAYIKNDVDFKKYYLELKNSNMCINNYIFFGNNIKENLKIDNKNINIINEDKIKKNLNIMLCCIIRYFEITENKNMYDLYQESRNLFIKKNDDYGDAFMDYISIGILVRLGDKVKRLENLTKKIKYNYESIEDTLFDSFNYIILFILVIDINN